MSFENKEARSHFLIFAYTSLDHPIEECYRDKVLSDIKNGKAEKGLEEKFTTALVGCSFLSKEKGKIDKATVDEWFLKKHNKISSCKAYEGTVIGLNGEGATVQTPQGQKIYKTKLKPNLKVGDSVKVHGDYVIE